MADDPLYTYSTRYAYARRNADKAEKAEARNEPQAGLAARSWHREAAKCARVLFDLTGTTHWSDLADAHERKGRSP